MASPTETISPHPERASLAKAVLTPRSVALVGVSDEPASTTGRPLAYLRAAPFTGAVYPVNPRRDTVQGERCWPSLSALPEVPDHVFLMIGRDGVLGLVEECGRLGVPVVTVLANGFSESGAAGARRERELVAVAAKHGVRLIGPNSIGVVNTRNGLVLTANAVFSEPALPTGTVMVASQSGSMIGSLVSRGRQLGLGFAGLISTGSESDLSIGELCAATLDDPGITSYLLFLENLKGARQLGDFARGAAERGKPVVVYKLGRSEAAAELAESHTGAIAGADDIAEEFFAAHGIARVTTLNGLLEAMTLAPSLGIRPAGAGTPRVGVVTTTGAGAAMVVDQLGIRAIDVCPPSTAVFERLAELSVRAAPGRIVDVTLAGAHYPRMKATMDTMLGSGEFDLVIAVVGSSARTQPGQALQAVIDSGGGPVALACFLVPDAPDAIPLLAEAGIPTFRTPEACADAIAALFGRRPPMPPLPAVRPAKAGHTLDEQAAYGLLDRLGIRRVSSIVLNVPEDPAAIDVSAVADAEDPLVVKVLSAGIPHKSDVGGVVLGVRGRDGVREAVARIAAAVRRRLPEVTVDRVLVQPQLFALGELLVGYHTDADVGPIVMLAAGGELTEIHRDRSIRMAPVDRATARTMLAEVAVVEQFRGFRGRPVGDLEALVDVLVALSELALDPAGTVLEAEINPLLVCPAGDGVVAVDALVQVRDDS